MSEQILIFLRSFSRFSGQSVTLFHPLPLKQSFRLALG